MTSNSDLVAAAKKWARIRPEYADILAAMCRVWEVTEVARAEVELPPGLDQHQALKADQGLPLVSRSQLPFDRHSAPDLFRRILAAVSHPDHPELGGLEELGRLVRDDDEAVCGLIEAFLAENAVSIKGLADRCGLSPAVLTFLARMTLRPSLGQLRQKLADRIEALDWSEGYCPLCGGPPDLAQLVGDGGARSLHCALCGQVWDFDRLVCPLCGQSDPGGISYFVAQDETETEKGLRVDYCQKCRSYIKTIDRREMTEPWPFEVVEVGTWHLDKLAKRRGLKTAPTRTNDEQLT